MNSEIRVTEDGSHTLFVPLIDECYHSTHGAVQESQHIFIDAGLNQLSKKSINVLEIGFGTGLNALLTLALANKKEVAIHYHTLEKFPLSPSIALQLNYAEKINGVTLKDFELLHNSAWDIECQLTPNFTFIKQQCDFTSHTLTAKYDVIFFDAFSPEKQPEMWTEALFENIYRHCNKAAVLTTYCAKGVVRRALQHAGFSVERLAGPPGKREILRATVL